MGVVKRAPLQSLGGWSDTCDVNSHQDNGGIVMPVISGFGELAGLPWERMTDKIERRIVAGQQGMVV